MFLVGTVGRLRAGRCRPCWVGERSASDSSVRAVCSWVVLWSTSGWRCTRMYVWAGVVQPFDRVCPWRNNYVEVVSVNLELVGVAPAEAVKKLHDVACRLHLGRCQRLD